MTLVTLANTRQTTFHASFGLSGDGHFRHQREKEKEGKN